MRFKLFVFFALLFSIKVFSQVEDVKFKTSLIRKMNSAYYVFGMLDGMEFKITKFDNSLNKQKEFKHKLLREVINDGGQLFKVEYEGNSNQIIAYFQHDKFKNSLSMSKATENASKVKGTVLRLDTNLNLVSSSTENVMMYSFQKYCAEWGPDNTNFLNGDFYDGEMVAKHNLKAAKAKLSVKSKFGTGYFQIGDYTNNENLEERGVFVLEADNEGNVKTVRGIDFKELLKSEPGLTKKLQKDKDFKLHYSVNGFIEEKDKIYLCVTLRESYVAAFPQKLGGNDMGTFYLRKYYTTAVLLMEINKVGMECKSKVLNVPPVMESPEHETVFDFSVYGGIDKFNLVLKNPSVEKSEILIRLLSEKGQFDKIKKTESDHYCAKYNSFVLIKKNGAFDFKSIDAK